MSVLCHNYNSVWFNFWVALHNRKQMIQVISTHPTLYIICKYTAHITDLEHYYSPLHVIFESMVSGAGSNILT